MSLSFPGFLFFCAAVLCPGLYGPNLDGTGLDSLLFAIEARLMDKFSGLLNYKFIQP
jgi:hypothetical protein